MAKSAKVEIEFRSAAEVVQSGCAESLAALQKYHARVLRFQAEPIHQMRIGTRRLRAILHIFAGIMDAEWASGLESELRWLAHLLGSVRDLDVLRERLRSSAKSDSQEVQLAFKRIDQVLSERYHDAKIAMREGLRSERYSALLERLKEGQLAPQLTLEAGSPALDSLLPELNRAWKKLSRAAEKLRASDEPAKYHRVRKMGKRIRYATEMLISDFGTTQRPRIVRFIKSMKQLQDTLGEFQDATIAVATIEHLHEREKTHPDGFDQIIAAQIKLQKKWRRKFPNVWSEARALGDKKWMRG